MLPLVVAPPTSTNSVFNSGFFTSTIGNNAPENFELLYLFNFYVTQEKLAIIRTFKGPYKGLKRPLKDLIRPFLVVCL